jgi:putative MFS transporter
VVVIALVAIAVSPPSISDTALIGAIPMALAALAVAFFGAETRKRQLEEITAEQLGAPQEYRFRGVSQGAPSP